MFRDEKDKNSKSYIHFLNFIYALFLFIFNISCRGIYRSDSYLLSIGVPRDVVDQLSIGQKESIFQKLEGNARFEVFDKRNFAIEDSHNPQIQPMGGLISKSDLTLSVISFSVEHNGIDCQEIFPSFVWHKKVALKNHSFGMALYPDWEVLPDELNETNLE